MAHITHMAHITLPSPYMGHKGINRIVIYTKKCISLEIEYLKNHFLLDNTFRTTKMSILIDKIN